jgi:DNA-binding NtrC family response regulator
MKPPVVLLVDDEEELRRSTAQALDLAGFRVQDFSAAERALDFVTQGFNGAIVTDIRMPSMDGMTLMRRVRSTAAGWCWKTGSSRLSPARRTTSRRACPAARRSWSNCAI